MMRISFPHSLLLAAALTFTAAACGGGDKPVVEQQENIADQAAADPNAPVESAPPAPAAGGELITKDQLKLGPIDEKMVAQGKGMYELKCQSCHSLGENRVVGPGWKGVASKRAPEWIMNMIVHTDAMLTKDPEAQKMLEECLVRMPNQNLSVEEARDVLEFMRSLDKKS